MCEKSVAFLVDILTFRQGLIHEGSLWGRNLRLHLARIETCLKAPNLLLQPEYVALHLSERVRRALESLGIEVVAGLRDSVQPLALQRVRLDPLRVLHAA